MIKSFIMNLHKKALLRRLDALLKRYIQDNDMQAGMDYAKGVARAYFFGYLSREEASARLKDHAGTAEVRIHEEQGPVIGPLVVELSKRYAGKMPPAVVQQLAQYLAGRGVTADDIDFGAMEETDTGGSILLKVKEGVVPQQDTKH